MTYSPHSVSHVCSHTPSSPILLPSPSPKSPPHVSLDVRNPSKGQQNHRKPSEDYQMSKNTSAEVRYHRTICTIYNVTLNDNPLKAKLDQLLYDGPELPDPLYMGDILSKELNENGLAYFTLDDIDLISLQLNGSWGDQDVPPNEAISKLFRCFRIASDLQNDSDSGADTECILACKRSISACLAVIIESDPLPLLPFLLITNQEFGGAESSISIPPGFLRFFVDHFIESEDEQIVERIFVPIIQNIICSARNFRLMDSFQNRILALRSLVSIPLIARMTITKCWIIAETSPLTRFVVIKNENLSCINNFSTFPISECMNMRGRDLVWTFLGAFSSISTIGDATISLQCFSNPTKRKGTDIRQNTEMFRRRLQMLREGMTSICMISL
jgi:hypothetical protein